MITQTYVDTKTTSTPISYILDINHWTHPTFLNLNPSHIEVLIIGPKSKVSKLSTFSLDIDGVTFFFFFFKPSSAVCNLGVIFDSSLSFKPHIRSLIKWSLIHPFHMIVHSPTLFSWTSSPVLPFLHSWVCWNWTIRCLKIQTNHCWGQIKTYEQVSWPPNSGTLYLNLFSFILHIQGPA